MNKVKSSRFFGFLFFIILLFGGVTVNHQGIATGATSCQAITVSRPPAKEKVASKRQHFYNRILKKLAKSDGGFGGKNSIPFVMVGSGILGIILGLWAVNLLTVGNLIGLLVGFFGVVSFALFLFLLFWFFI